LFSAVLLSAAGVLAAPSAPLLRRRDALAERRTNGLRFAGEDAPLAPAAVSASAPAASTALCLEGVVLRGCPPPTANAATGAPDLRGVRAPAAAVAPMLVRGRTTNGDAPAPSADACAGSSPAAVVGRCGFLRGEDAVDEDAELPEDRGGGLCSWPAAAAASAAAPMVERFTLVARLAPVLGRL